MLKVNAQLFSFCMLLLATYLCNATEISIEDKLQQIVISAGIESKFSQIIKTEHGSLNYGIKNITKKTISKKNNPNLTQADLKEINDFREMRLREINHYYNLDNVLTSQIKKYKDDIELAYIDQAYIESKKGKPNLEKFTKFYEIAQKDTLEMVDIHIKLIQDYNRKMEEIINRSNKR